jgi:drug/metabolite transporter (DMT)-like permease
MATGRSAEADRESAAARPQGLASASPVPPRPSTRAVALWTLGLFLVWSHTFLAFEVLLAPRAGDAPTTWAGLVVLRFVPVAVVCGAWCLLARRAEAARVVRRHPVRLAFAALLCVPAYNGFLYFGMQHRVSGPVASLLTTLAPLYLLVLGVAFLGERLTTRKVASLALGLAGVVLIATAREPRGGASYALHVALTALAPLAWSGYTAISKPVLATVPPVLWTSIVLAVGGAPLALLLPWVGGPDALRFDVVDWALLAYLSLAATVLGFAVWSWLLRFLPASTVGLTVFLNPPLTTASKASLSAVLPATFAFSVATREWVGGALALAGVAIAVLRRPRA